MNVWRRGSVTENPYTRTPFRVAIMTKEVTRRATIVQYIEGARAVVNADPEAHKVGGKAVTLEEINQAEAILLSPEKRILEDLLSHAPEVLPLERVRQLAKKVEEAIVLDTQAAGASPDRETLETLLHDLITRYLDSTNPAEPWFGALETAPVPPFGEQGKE
jgi:hypothetical protein